MAGFMRFFGARRELPIDDDNDERRRRSRSRQGRHRRTGTNGRHQERVRTSRRRGVDEGANAPGDRPLVVRL